MNEGTGFLTGADGAPLTAPDLWFDEPTLTPGAAEREGERAESEEGVETEGRGEGAERKPRAER